MWLKTKNNIIKELENKIDTIETNLYWYKNETLTYQNLYEEEIKRTTKLEKEIKKLNKALRRAKNVA